MSVNSVLSQLLDVSQPVGKIREALNLTRGPALKCNYVVTVIPPTSANFLASITRAPISALAWRQLSVLAKNAELPGRTISTTPHRMYGTIREMPYGVLYDTIDITFMCTNSMVERAFFNLWQEFIISPKSCYLNYYKDYVGTIIIQKVDNSLDPISIIGSTATTFTLEDAYPKIIKAQDVSYDSKNEILTLTVTFSYARWRSRLEKLETFAFSRDSSAVFSPISFVAPLT